LIKRLRGIKERDAPKSALNIFIIPLLYDFVNPGLRSHKKAPSPASSLLRTGGASRPQTTKAEDTAQRVCYKEVIIPISIIGIFISEL
jgi:hypothetical protein